MRKVIILKSRYGMKNFLERLPGDTKTYLLKTEIDTLRASEDDEGYVFVDPSGGPFIARGAYLEEADAIVKSIGYLEGQGFTITFE